MRPQLVILVLFMALASALAPVATQAAQPKVVVVSGTACCPETALWDAEQRLIRELGLVGLEVVVLPGAAGDEADRRDELERLCAGQDAAAALRLTRSSDSAAGRMDLWVADRITGKTTLRHLDLGTLGNDEAATVAAIRAVELLAVSLRELGDAPSESPATANREPPDQALVALADTARPETGPDRVTASTFGIGLGANAVGTPGDAGPFAALALSGVWRPLPALGIDLLARSTVAGRHIRHDGAAATLDLAGLDVVATWQLAPERFVQPFLGLGLGAAVAWSTGSSEQGQPVSTERAFASRIAFHAGLGLRLHELVRLVLDAELGLLAPGIAVRFAGERVAGLGQPLLGGTLGLVIVVPD